MSKKKSATQVEVEKVEREVSRNIKRLNEQVAEEKAKLVLAVKSAKVIEPLLKLKSDKAVEKFLRDRNIRGIVGSSSKCPIAQYLREKGPKGADIEVDGVNVTLDGITVDATRAIEDFIGRFDDGEIPALDRKKKAKAAK